MLPDGQLLSLPGGGFLERPRNFVRALGPIDSPRLPADVACQHAMPGRKRHVHHAAGLSRRSSSVALANRRSGHLLLVHLCIHPAVPGSPARQIRTKSLSSPGRGLDGAGRRQLPVHPGAVPLYLTGAHGARGGIYILSHGQLDVVGRSRSPGKGRRVLRTVWHHQPLRRHHRPGAFRVSLSDLRLPSSFRRRGLHARRWLSGLADPAGPPPEIGAHRGNSPHPAPAGHSADAGHCSGSAGLRPGHRAPLCLRCRLFAQAEHHRSFGPFPP